ncbi:MAG TPA: hypothetical protein PKC30_10385 [Saprospiraceae bacterium]|nr:hypothetical protein [Saprospiraceae bacterium]
MMKNFIWIFIALFFWNCRHEPRKFIPVIDDIYVDFNVVRYDRYLAELDFKNPEHSYSELRDSLPAFTYLYFHEILGLEGSDHWDQPDFYEQFRAFREDERISFLLDTVTNIFGNDIQFFKNEFTTPFKLLKYYFPHFIPPNIYTIISEYAFQQFLFEDEFGEGIGIGLDMFLGEDFPYQKIAPGNPAFSSYLTRTFNKDHIVRKSLELILDDLLEPPAGNRFIDIMIHHGKTLYVLEHVLPYAHDSILLEYTTEQTQWVKENEIEIWAYFLNEQLFYETDMVKINKYLFPGPHSPGMPEAAPGRTGNYIGWQIVKSFMNRNSEYTLANLIQMSDAQKILEDSRYKPRRK